MDRRREQGGDGQDQWHSMAFKRVLQLNNYRRLALLIPSTLTGTLPGASCFQGMMEENKNEAFGANLGTRARKTGHKRNWN